MKPGRFFIGATLLAFLSLFVNAQADVQVGEKHFLTVDELIIHNYTKLTGQQILDLMSRHSIKVIDIETDAVALSTRKKSEAGMEREFEGVKDNKALYFLDARLLARAPALEGQIDRKVVGNELVATDGIRTYRYTVYKKQNRMFAVRDIDNGNVYYELEVK